MFVPLTVEGNHRGNQNKKEITAMTTRRNHMNKIKFVANVWRWFDNVKQKYI
jgi:hypothetical protein